MMGGVNEDNHALVKRAIARDRAAVHSLIKLLTPVVQARVGRVLLRRGVGRTRDLRQEVLDLTQQVFVALFEKDAHLLRSWDPARGASLENFVGMIAHQQALATFRSQSSSLWRDEIAQEDNDIETGVDSSQTPERIFASRQIMAAILEKMQAQLSERGLELFRLIYVEGRSVEEIQTVANLTSDAVYAWRSRLRRQVAAIARQIVSDADECDPNPAVSET